MELDRLTEKAAAAVGSAQQLCIKMGQQQVDGEHLNLALLTQSDGLIPKLLQYMGADAAQISAAVEAELQKLPKIQGASAQV